MLSRISVLALTLGMCTCTINLELISLIDLCFSPGDSANKMLSIDFFPSTDAVKSLITTHDLKAIYSELNRLQGELQETFRNQQFQAERDFVHRNVLESTENHIKWLGVLRVFLLLGSALVQLWIMKEFLRNKVQPYEPVS